MNGIKRFSILSCVLLLAAPCLSAQATTDDVLRSLLAEVRALRVTLQRSSLLGLRGDLLVERIRTAQSRVASTQDQIDGVRQQIGAIDQESKRFEAEIEQLEDRMAREYDAEALEQLKLQVDQYAGYSTTLTQQVETLRRTEAEMLARLDEASARLDGLEAEFDDLLKEIERQLKEPE